ncbi:SigE family RNA polymerase sigma factor [Nocardioides acrostichi]|uniref:SigE family RNA polymerase sigma factor n=1 Tax=Nocardioides acrostichi TaxID=2784339 RepID=A0A930UXN1_9ACTN|nr:SigE family RNA polymerase sigma factor [Nocardioides acrostichi]MBF4162768.1 SigE family RNA polymerase sigma factor [Nocardioides acrostichi]
MDTQEEAAYAAFVDASWRDLVRAAVFLGADPHEAQDLAQTTLVRCYDKWAQVDGAERREAYVYRMLVNAFRDNRRSRWWKQRSEADPADHLDDHPARDRTDQVATADAVHRALAGLSKTQREVVTLRYFVQLSEAQTAAALGVPAGTVKSRLSRALAALARDRHLLDIGDPS